LSGREKNHTFCEREKSRRKSHEPMGTLAGEKGGGSCIEGGKRNIAPKRGGGIRGWVELGGVLGGGWGGVVSGRKICWKRRGDSGEGQ